MVGRATHRLDAWSASADRLIDVHPSALLGVAVGFVRLIIGLLTEAAAGEQEQASSSANPPRQ
ncbi:MAG TPA: hypothetical protein VLX92_17875 [Kofleriaceae bacterium]|nr:hypothetical protein [Kofleriaceae bacterium]